MAIALLVDHNTDDLELLEQAIMEIRADVNVVKVNHGLKALLILDSGLLPDYIFLDINMPLMSGIDCLKIFRVDKRFASTIVTVMSTSVTPIDILACNALNAYCLDKPVDYNRLKENP